MKISNNILFAIALMLLSLQGCGLIKSAAQKEKAKSDHAHAYMALHPEEFAADCNRYFKPVENDIVENEYVPGVPTIDTSNQEYDISGLIENAINSALPNIQDSIKAMLLDSLKAHPQKVNIKVANKKSVDTLKSNHNKTILNTAELAVWQQLYKSAHDSSIGFYALYQNALKQDSTATYKSKYNDQLKKYNNGIKYLKWGGIALAIIIAIIILKKIF
jgi:post-segregation antitoxin (ccd killing protein)